MDRTPWVRGPPPSFAIPARFMLQPIGNILAGQRRKAWVVAAALTAMSARSALGDTDPLTLDDHWYVAVARAESVLSEARVGVSLDSMDRAAIAEQMRLSIYVLGALVQGSISADTLLSGPSASARPERGWRNRLAGIAGMVSGVTSLTSLITTRSASSQTQRALAWIGGSAAAIGGIFRRSRAPTEPASDSAERIRAVGLESDLHEAVQQNERAADALWRDLREMALDSCATTDQVVTLARHYANALPASEALRSGIARSSALARACAQYPGFDRRARNRFEELASHFAGISDLWQERRWLFERSSRNALDYLVLVDHP